MQKFSTAAILAVSIQAAWHDMKVEVNGSEETKQIKSKPWSTIEHMDMDHCALVPNNNSFTLHNQPREDFDTFYKPELRGGSIQYTVDLSAMDCGCVAGVYGVKVDGDCDPNDSQSMEKPECAVIDVMNANPFGFNVAARPNNGSSQCEYQMREQGK